MPKSWGKKRERQYGHVLKSTGSKRIAAATVNKSRAKAGETKKKKTSRKRKKKTTRKRGY